MDRVPASWKEVIGRNSYLLTPVDEAAPDDAYPALFLIDNQHVNIAGRLDGTVARPDLLESAMHNERRLFRDAISDFIVERFPLAEAPR